MTVLGPETLKAIEAHKKAARLADIRQRQEAYQIRQMVRRGFGWEDLVVELKVSREVAREAVFGAKR